MLELTDGQISLSSSSCNHEGRSELAQLRIYGLSILEGDDIESTTSFKAVETRPESFATAAPGEPFGGLGKLDSLKLPIESESPSVDSSSAAGSGTEFNFCAVVVVDTSSPKLQFPSSFAELFGVK